MMLDKLHSPDLYLVITNKCNLNCGYCYIHNRKQEEESPSLGDLITAIDKVNPGKVIITGGEPMMNAKLINTLLSYYDIDNARHWRCALCTNLAYDMNDDILSVFNQVDYIQTTYTYDKFSDIDNSIKFMDNSIIACMVDNVKNFDIMFTVTPKSMSIDPKINIDFIYRLNADGVMFEPLSGNNIGEEYYKKYDEYLLECCKEVENKDMENLLLKSWKNCIKAGLPMHCNVCADNAVMVFDPVSKEVKNGCPCYVDPHTNRRIKFATQCLECEYFKYCKMGCERFGNHCAFPKKTFDYYKDKLETL